MKVIICGGRDFHDHEFLHRVMAAWIEVHGMPSEIVSGGAFGADKMGEEWAVENRLPFMIFPAAWREHGPKAGPMRNGEMAAYADACIALPGGRGTADMIKQARQRRLLVMDTSVSLEPPERYESPWGDEHHGV